MQTSDLCIIDLTSHNPNVFYECGRRHENGRPFIQLIHKGEKLPFDVAGIRTISYDLSDPRSTLESVREIQNFVKGIKTDGYGAGSTGDSLTSIADGITRIERTLNQLTTEVILNRHTTPQTVTTMAKDVFTKHPITAFNEAFNSGNIELAIQILPRIKKLIGIKDWLRSAILLAQAGETAGEAALIDAITNHIADLDSALASEGYFGLREYYKNRNMLEQGISSLKKIYNDIVKRVEFSDKEKALLLGYIQVFQFQIGDDESSIRTGLEVIKLHRDAITLANLARVYKEMNRLDEAVTYVDEYIQLPDATANSLQTAIDVYTLLKRDKDAKTAKELLQKLQVR